MGRGQDHYTREGNKNLHEPETGVYERGQWRLRAVIFDMKRGGDRIVLGIYLGMGEGGRLYTVYRGLETQNKAGWEGFSQLSIVRAAGHSIAGND